MCKLMQKISNFIDICEKVSNKTNGDTEIMHPSKISEIYIDNNSEPNNVLTVLQV